MFYFCFKLLKNEIMSSFKVYNFKINYTSLWDKKKLNIIIVGFILRTQNVFSRLELYYF